MRELEIEEIKRIQNEILRTFASFCESNGLNYYLAYGTLIGAIRHQGYIPWDDDIDVIMPRPDYERFINTFSNTRYKVFCPEHDKRCPFTYGKLYDSYTLIEENTSRKYEIGLNIDIFIIDGLPSDEKASSKQINRNSFWINILEVKKIAYSSKRSFIRNAELFLLKAGTFMFPYTWVRNRIIQINKQFLYDEMEFCADMCYTGALRLRKSVFETSKECLFEGRRYAIPFGYDSWLRAYYGDYMQLPPKEQRITHHDYKAFTIK